MSQNWVVSPMEIERMDMDELERQIREVRDKITDMQRVLCEGLSSGKTALQAGIDAGYSNRKGNLQTTVSVSNVLKNPRPALYLALLREKAARGAETTAVWLRVQLKDYLERCKQEDDRNNEILAYREFAKIDGLYSPERRVLEGNIKVNGIEELTDDEMDALMLLRHGAEMSNGTTH